MQQIAEDQHGNWGVRRFGDRPSIAVDNFPTLLTTGLDGSIWVASERGTVQRVVKTQDGNWIVENPSILVGDTLRSLTAGLDGSIWVGGLKDTGSYTFSPSGVMTQLVNVNGIWTVQSQILVDVSPMALSTDVDGSIWLINDNFSTLQHIVQDEFGRSGVEQFGERPSIQVVEAPAGLTLGFDGSVWVGSSDWKFVQKIVNERGRWFVKEMTISIVEGGVNALRTGLDGSIWVDTGTVVRQLWTNPAAPNFAGTSPVATLLVGHGRPSRASPCH